MNFLKWVFNPRFWIVIHKFDKRTDSILRSIITRNIKPIHISEHYASFNLNGLCFDIWIGNYPYAYGEIWLFSEENYRPSRSTIYEFNQYMQQFLEPSKTISKIDQIYKEAISIKPNLKIVNKAEELQ